MARNLLDDDDWAHLSAIVGASVEKQLELTEKGSLARIDKRLADQAGALEQIQSRMGEAPTEVTALRSQLTNVAALVAQLRRIIGSGNLETEVNAQASSVFAEIAGELGTTPILNIPVQPDDEEDAPKKKGK